MVTQDITTRMIILVPFKENMSAEDMADAYIEHVYLRGFGLPRCIRSDRDSRMTSDFWTALFNKLGTSLHMSTAYQHTPHGNVERANQEIQKYLRFFASSSQNDWDNYLKFAEFAFNDSNKSGTGYTPFELNGMNPRTPAQLLSQMAPRAKKRVLRRLQNSKSSKEKKAEAYGKWIESLTLKLEDARVNLQKATEQRLSRLNRNRRACPESFAIGRKVWLKAGNLTREAQAKVTDKIPPMHRKLAPQYLGPFEITKVIGTHRFRLNIPAVLRIYNEFDASLLKPYVVRAKEAGEDVVLSDPGAPPSLVPVDVDELVEDEFYIEKILAHHFTRNGRLKYLIKFVGYDDSHNLWLDEKDVFMTQNFLKDYYDHPKLVLRI